MLLCGAFGRLLLVLQAMSASLMTARQVRCTVELSSEMHFLL